MCLKLYAAVASVPRYKLVRETEFDSEMTVTIPTIDTIGLIQE